MRRLSEIMARVGAALRGTIAILRRESHGRRRRHTQETAALDKIGDCAHERPMDQTFLEDLYACLRFYSRLPTPSIGGRGLHAGFSARRSGFAARRRSDRPLRGRIASARASIGNSATAGRGLRYCDACRRHRALCMKTDSPTSPTGLAAARRASVSSKSCATAGWAPTGLWR